MDSKTTLAELRDRLAETERELAALRTSKAADIRSEGEQQQSFLLKLSDTIRALSDPDAIAATATRMVFDHFGVDRCFISRLAPEEQKAWLEHEVRKPHLPSVEGEVNLVDFPDAMRTLETEALVLRNVPDDPNLSELDKRSLAGLSAGSLLAAMLRKGERNCLWDIVVITEQPRNWSAEELHLLEELAERVWSAMERAGVENALRASERQSREAMQIAEQRAAELTAVIDSMNDAVYIGTVDGITQVNRTALTHLGFTEKEELNQPVDVLAQEIDTRDPETGERISGEDQPFSRAFHGERSVRLVQARHRETGEERIIRCAAAPVMLNGKIIAAVAVNTDVTEQRKTEAALRQTEKLAAVGRLASSIAHEINNPLEAVTNLLYLAHKEPVSPAVAGYLEQAQNELARVSQITTETLRFHRQQSVPSHFDMVAIVESVLLLHEGRLRASQVEVERRYSPHPTVLCLANEIRQVVANLVGNGLDAIQSSDGERRLRVRVRQAVNPATGVVGVRLTVSDTGTGISESSRSQIFQPFFTTKATTGTGLGLWVSAEIVRKHNGRLRFRSSGVAGYQGTVFSLLLSDMVSSDGQAGS